MVFTAKNPLVLGTGYAATRDIISFFHNDASDSNGTANPIAGLVKKVISAGVSQSGSFIRSGIHLGFNADEQGRQVVDGAWPQIDGRQLYMNVRFALPDVITNLYMMSDEAPVWWADYPDLARHFGPEGMLDRCKASRTCPEIMETFGSLEMYDEKMSPNLIGFTAQGDIPLPQNVHRYYFPATTHGGGCRRLHLCRQSASVRRLHPAGQSQSGIGYGRCAAGGFRRLRHEWQADAAQRLPHPARP
ncbi:MAG: hypothetical protein WDN69_02830 [Aliidongia sp.]